MAADITASEPYMKPATRLRKLLSQPGVCIQAPGVYDGICARIAIEQGFQVMYQSGSMTTAARLGRADLAFASLNDFAQNAHIIANIDPRIPLIADADVGFGSPPNVARMVQTYDSCGIAGFHIEDEVSNKLCGHLQGKKVVDMDTWKSRIRACVIGRDSIYGGSEIVIIARTDALAVEGYDAALARLMVNLVSLGKTPWFPPETLGKWGVKLAIYPGAAGKSVIHTIRRAYKYLLETGKDDAEAQGLDLKGFFDVMGLQREIEIDRLAGGMAFGEQD
ncbi:Pyruvate/Phosphoenolpyruvate kinase-like domain-containing protein [Xylariales sp. PMI_506]|nr:Pyruvate/Phosphoenolpyruvate kinase-like domain-containing protein [Xylariales sp. PMI_506]